MASWQNLQPFVQGGASSVLAEVVTFPLDLTKTRLQIQVGIILFSHLFLFIEFHLIKGQILQSQHSVIKYSGVSQAIRRIIAEEGFFALYSG